MSHKTSLLPATIMLNNGISMPLIHLGVYMTSGRECYNAVTHALNAGYRAIDSAEWYENEEEVGEAINAFIRAHSQDGGKAVTREDIWFTTKLKDNVDYQSTRRRIQESIRKSGLGWIDLYLLHSPYGGKKKRIECWRAVCDAVKTGEVRCVGVSNFGAKHLRDILDSSPPLIPAVNQIEVHPFNTRTSLAALCHSNSIAVEAYAPLARALRMRHPVVVELSRKYNCEPAQLLIRWSIQKGYVPLPKSVHEDRIVSNGQVGGWEIEEGDMGKLDGCDEGLVTDWDPTNAP